MEKVFCYLKIKDVGYEGQEEPPEDFSILKFNDLNFTYPNATKKTLHNITKKYNITRNDKKVNA